LRFARKRNEDMKDSDLPRPEQTHTHPRAEAERTARHDAIAAWAADMAGTNLDLDPDLESAEIECLLKTGRAGG